MRKEYFFKTAMVKGLSGCYVGISQWNEANNTYLCRLPYTETLRWMSASELENFCL